MRRREVISLIAGATAWPLAARAQQPAKPVVGVLAEFSESTPLLTAAFRKGLADAGYIEGKDIALENRFGNYKRELLSEAVGDLIRRNVTVIFASTPEAVAVAANVATSIPIVALD